MQHLFEHFFLSSGHGGFMEDDCITFIDKTELFIPIKNEDYRRQKPKILVPDSLNIENSV